MSSDTSCTVLSTSVTLVVIEFANGCVVFQSSLDFNFLILARGDERTDKSEYRIAELQTTNRVNQLRYALAHQIETL